MLTKDFWYNLPPAYIAQQPASPRDHAKLMTIDPRNQTIGHRRFYDLPDLLGPDDLIIVNNSKVFKARLKATKENREFEIFLLHSKKETWIALAKPGKKLRIGDIIGFDEDLKAEVWQKNNDGTVELKFNQDANAVLEFTERHGEIPVPPYIAKAPDDASLYQTVYAEKIGSAAAPTAGFHFTPELISVLKSKGITFAAVTLHVGLGTFRPVKTKRVEDHVMHAEWIDVPQDTVDLILEAKLKGGRIIAVGTTSVRSLESAARSSSDKGRLKSFSGFTDLFIKPGDPFHVVDAMITNFHLPASTLIMLVSAFAQSKMAKPDAGRKLILRAYQEAIQNNYRFYSFGDAMIIS